MSTDKFPAKVKFYYISDFGFETELTQTICVDDYSNEFEALVDQFKLFLLACSFSPETVDRVKISYE